MSSFLFNGYMPTGTPYYTHSVCMRGVAVGVLGVHIVLTPHAIGDSYEDYEENHEQIH